MLKLVYSSPVRTAGILLWGSYKVAVYYTFTLYIDQFCLEKFLTLNVSEWIVVHGIKEHRPFIRCLLGIVVVF